MKGYYVHFNARDTIGVSQKIDMHMEEFSKHYEMEEIDIRMSSKNFFRNAFSVLPYVSICWDYTAAYDKIDSPDFLYIRKVGGDRKHYLFLKHIKTKYPKCKIVMEIPTYPYWKEGLQSLASILLIKDFFNYRFLLNKYIDRVITFSTSEKIFNIPTIRIMNGINVDKISMIDEVKDGSEEVLDIIGVAVHKPHHGYERLIKGIAKYYEDGGTRKICLHLVGDGPEKESYQSLVKKQRLEDLVKFYPTLKGNDLQKVYNKADMAVSALGFYKDKVVKISTLKVKEYLAEGLPVITGGREDSFDKDKSFCCEFPNDSSIIDMKKVFDFYDRLRQQNSRVELARQIRKYAMENVDNSITLNPVFEYINGK